MSPLDGLSDYLQRENPYPCLGLLESAMVCYARTAEKVVPGQLLADLGNIYGHETMDVVLADLVLLGALVETNQGIMLNSESLSYLSSILDRIRNQLRLNIGIKEETTAEFMVKLITYLRFNVPGLEEAKINESSGFVLHWEGAEYRILPALTPAWLPAVAYWAAAKNIYIALFGPFAAQGWEKMAGYYRYPEFRNHTAYYDPWNCQKMNISRGGLFAFFDWFFRDVFRQKFFIPESFALALNDMGLLRLNDER